MTIGERDIRNWIEQEVLDDEIIDTAKDSLLIISVPFFGLLAVFSWNTLSLNLGYDILNTPLVRGGFLFVSLIIALKLDIYLLSNSRRNS